MSYRFRQLPKFCLSTEALLEVQHTVLDAKCVRADCTLTERRGFMSLYVEFGKGGLEEHERGGEGPVIGEMFQLKLKMNRCCIFITALVTEVYVTLVCYFMFFVGGVG